MPSENTHTEPEQRIALALSGGGLRATLFHLGVIRYLRATGKLSQVKVVASVSGGSITAAHLVQRWRDYSGSIEDFEKAASKLRSLANYDLRGRILRRLLPILPGAFLARATRLRPLIPRTATELLEHYYRVKLFQSKRLSDLDDEGLPLLFIVTTNLTRGEASAFWREGIFNIPIGGEPPESIPAPGIRLATAVAASSAYPGLFPPLELEAAQIAAPEDKFDVESFADGGVTDNLGTFVLDHVRQQFAFAIDRIVVSDAGRSYVGLDRADPNFVWTALRSTDLMMYRIREQQLQQIEQEGSQPDVIAISDTSDASDSAPRAIEKRLQEVRTDLDRFPPDLAKELERHGFFIAEKIFGDLAPQEWRPSWQEPKDGDHLEQRILSAASRKFWPLSPRDWLSYLYLAAIVFLLVFSYKAVHLLKPKAELAVSFLKMSGTAPPWSLPSYALSEKDVLSEIQCDPGSDLSFDEQHRVWDLRKLIWTGEPDGAVGPSLLTRSQTVTRRPSGAGLFRFTFQTSGRIVAVWVRDNKYPLRLYRAQGDGLRQVGDSRVEPWCIEVDLSSIKPGDKAAFSTQIEIVDAFKGTNRWTGMRNTPPVSLASMRIIFPPVLPFKNARFSSQPNDRNVQADLDGVEVLQTETDILWAVYKPRADWTYRVDWDWVTPSAGVGRNRGRTIR